jgi:CBS domain-containing protein
MRKNVIPDIVHDQVLAVVGGDTSVQDVAAALDPEKTSVASVMTADPDTITPDEIPVRALRRMQLGGYRHLPVVRNDEVIGIVSRRDFFGEEEALLDQETYLWEHIR